MDCILKVKMGPLRTFFFLFALLSGISTAAGNNDTTSLLDALDDAQNDSARVGINLELGAWFMDNDPARATLFFEDALELSREKESEFFTKSAAICFNHKGIISTIQGDYSQSVAYYQNALEIFTALSEQHPGNPVYSEGIANILGNIGTIYYHQESYIKAVEYWEKAIGVIQTLNIPHAEAQLLNNIGVIYSEKKELGKALEYFNKALEIFEQEGSEKDIAMCYTNIGDVFNAMELYSKALELFHKSLELKLKTNDKHGIIQCYLSISDLYFNMAEFSKSIEFSKKATAMSEQINDKKDLRNGYELLSKNHAALGNYQQAYSWYMKFKSMNDSIFNKENQDRFMELQSQYESKIREKEIRLLRQSGQYQRRIKELLFAGIFFILIMSALLVFSIWARRKKDKTIYLQEKKLLEQEKQLINNELATKDLKTKELNQEIDYKT
nr:tetratricopeptide repeat protein [Bacteroidota bacterium]